MSTGNLVNTGQPPVTPTTPMPRPAASESADQPAASNGFKQITVLIRPTRGLAALELKELWAHRELLYFLAWRDVKVRYKQTAIGVAWIIIQPLLMTLIFTAVLGIIARVPFEGPAYPLFVFAGLTPWNYFASSLNSSGNSLVGNAHLITKVYFPRMIIPAAAVAGRLVDLSIMLLILAGLLLYYRVPPTLNALMLPVLIALTILLTLAFTLLVSAINVKYRDMGMALPVLVQLGMFVSPVLYPPGIVPEAWWRLYALNPLVGIIGGFRAALIGGAFDWFALGVSAAATAVMLVSSAYLFRRVEKSFADII